MNTPKPPSTGTNPESHLGQNEQVESEQQTVFEEKTAQSPQSELESASQKISQAVDKTVNLTEQTESAAEKLKKYQIIHLDDDLTILKANSRMLSPSALKYTGLNTSAQLLEALANADLPTIVISDNDIGEVNTGIDLAGITQEIRQKKNIPFILYSTGPRQGQETKFKEYLDKKIINVFMAKPASRREVLDILENLIKK
jgi:CheY-like chemotaxis protein